MTRPGALPLLPPGVRVCISVQGHAWMPSDVAGKVVHVPDCGCCRIVQIDGGPVVRVPTERLLLQGEA